MFKLILRTNLRSILKRRPSSIIGMITLAVGAVTTGFLLYYFHYENSYDNFHEYAEHTYRVNTLAQNERGEKHQMAIAPIPAGPVFKREIEEVLDFVRLQPLQPTVSHGSKVFEEEHFFLTDNSFFEVFSFPIVSGNKINPLISPNTIVLTESVAQKYFGEEDPLGKLIEIEVKQTHALNFTKQSFVVTAVAKDPPMNTHLNFRFLGSLSTMGNFKSNDWLGGVNTYVRLNSNHREEEVNQTFIPIIRQYMGPYLQSRFNMSFDEYLASGRKTSFFLQPLQSIHIDAGLKLELSKGVQQSFLYLLLAAALLVLLLTCINYFNMSLANGLSRLKEIGIRKSVGASYGQIFALFIIESFGKGIISLGFALFFSLSIVPLADLFQIPLVHNFYLSIKFVFLVISMTFFICLLTGIFLAFNLSKIPIPNGLKNKYGVGVRKIKLQKILLSIQFFVAFISLIGASIFQSQSNFLVKKDLGFEKENVLIVRNMEKISENAQQVLINQWSTLPQITSVSLSYHVPGQISEKLTFIPHGFEAPETPLQLKVLGVDKGFIETYDLKILSALETNSFIKQDSSFVLINEEAMKHLGFLSPEDVIGKKLKLASKVLNIAGVVKDFHYENLYHMIEPLVIMAPSAFPEPPLNPYRFTSLKLRQVKPEVLTTIEQNWDMLELSIPFSFSFLQDELAYTYKAEFQLATIIKGASIITILLACLGLLSLSQLLLKVRLKEIAIRKVLGANNITIYQLFIYQFLGVFTVAFILALPPTIWYFNQWLSNFAYRISLEWELFVFPAILLFILTIGILSIDAIRAYNQDVVDNLRKDR